MVLDPYNQTDHPHCKSRPYSGLSGITELCPNYITGYGFSDAKNGSGEIMLFGVRVVVDSMRKSVSLNNLSPLTTVPMISDKYRGTSASEVENWKLQKEYISQKTFDFERMYLSSENESNEWTHPFDQEMTYSHGLEEQRENVATSVIGQLETGLEEHHYQALVVDPNNNLVQDLMVNEVHDEVSNDEHNLVQEQIAREDHSLERVLNKRKKASQHWTEEEHRLFLIGLKKYGKGHWTDISKHSVPSKTPSQVASHAQKYFLHQSTTGKKRKSIHDTTESNISDDLVPHPIVQQQDESPTPNVPMRQFEEINQMQQMNVHMDQFEEMQQANEMIVGLCGIIEFQAQLINAQRNQIQEMQQAHLMNIWRHRIRETQEGQRMNVPVHHFQEMQQEHLNLVHNMPYQMRGSIHGNNFF